MKPRIRCIVSIDIDESRRRGPGMTVSQILSKLSAEVASRSLDGNLSEAEMRRHIERGGGLSQLFSHDCGTGTIHIGMQEDGPLGSPLRAGEVHRFTRADKREAVRR